MLCKTLDCSLRNIQSIIQGITYIAVTGFVINRLYIKTSSRVKIHVEKWGGCLGLPRLLDDSLIRITFSGGGTDSQLIDVNHFICQLFYMELSNFNSLDISALICEDHFLKFLI